MDDPRRQFDFWLGEWRCTWEGGAGANTIALICEGAVVHESFRSEDAELVGTSISVYDAAAGVWVQTWMDNQGSWFHLTGRFADGVMDLYTTTPDADGFRKRMRFSGISDDAWARSADMAAWDALWAISYTRLR
jgi:hypothetical protein